MTYEELMEMAHIECDKLLKSEKGYNGISFPEFWAEGYKKGITEGKPKWHDLRKDPNDLPPKAREDAFYTKVVLDADGNKVYYDFLFDKWYDDYTDGVVSGVTAWCELPKYREVE